MWQKTAVTARQRRVRSVLPADGLARSGLSHAALADGTHRHRLPALLTPVAERLAADASRAVPAGLPRALRIQQAIDAALLDELCRSGLAAVDECIGLTPLRKLRLALVMG